MPAHRPGSICRTLDTLRGTACVPARGVRRGWGRRVRVPAGGHDPADRRARRDRRRVVVDTDPRVVAGIRRRRHRRRGLSSASRRRRRAGRDRHDDQLHRHEPDTGHAVQLHGAGVRWRVSSQCLRIVARRHCNDATRLPVRGGGLPQPRAILASGADAAGATRRLALVRRRAGGHGEGVRQPADGGEHEPVRGHHPARSIRRRARVARHGVSSGFPGRSARVPVLYQREQRPRLPDLRVSHDSTAG